MNAAVQQPSTAWTTWLADVDHSERREDETADQWTDRIAREGRKGGRKRQCSIGYHDECSAGPRNDRTDKPCGCPCHDYDKGRIAAGAREAEAAFALQAAVLTAVLALHTGRHECQGPTGLVFVYDQGRCPTREAIETGPAA